MRKAILSLVGIAKREGDVSLAPGDGEVVGKAGFWSRALYLRLLILMVVIAVTVVIFLFRDRILDFQSYGYLGLFAVTALTSATIFLPLPTALIVFALGGVLNPLLVGVSAGVGGGLGELTGYMLGYSGQTFVEKSRVYTRMERWMKRRGSIVIFVVSFVPNPFLDIAGFVAGALRYPVWKFLFLCVLAKTLRSIGFALAGAWSVPWVLELIKRFFGGSGTGLTP